MTSASEIIPRDPDVDLANVPRHWLADNAVATAIANGINLLFPAGERFFVRSVNRFLPRIEDPVLRAQIKGFFGQEGRHAHAHDQFNAVLRAQGFEVDRFLDIYQRLSRWIEDRMSPELRLAVTAASEHFTAMLADAAFEQHILDACDPRMRELLAWHAAEEIEHKAVAYDVLQLVDPSYALRVRGLILATVLLGGFWSAATAVLMWQDRARMPAPRQRAAPSGGPSIRQIFARGIRSYLRRDFHPRQIANHDLAAAWFAARGMTLPQAA